MALTNKLTAIGDAIRAKTGTTDLMTLDAMATAIQSITTEEGSGECSGLHIPEEALTITGNCTYKFSYDNWNWFLEEYKDNITTNNITGDSIFYSAEKIETIPLVLNFANDTYYSVDDMFYGCYNLKEISDIVNLYPSKLDGFFNYCSSLRYLPNFINLNLNRMYTYASVSMGKLFAGCYSLRNISEEFLRQLYTPLTTGYKSVIFYQGFNCCYALDEIRGLNPQTGKITKNMFNGCFSYCSRVSDIIFALQDNGMPYTTEWSTQTIDLSTCIGYFSSESDILNYNSGITKDKQVKDDATYQALKDDPDWFTGKVAYSRYNHDSAVATINSLPDTSAYLATAGGTNTIKFNGAAGELTDGGAINTLTEEEIAVATAKGWTVTLV